MHGNKTQDTENLCDCLKVCVKNTDFRVSTTAAVSFNSSFFFQQISNKNIVTILKFSETGILQLVLCYYRSTTLNIKN